MIMTFINEKISSTDWENYNLKSLEKVRKNWGYSHTDWAIDREREIWLCVFARTYDRDNYGYWDGVTKWSFYWKGLLLLPITMTHSALSGKVYQHKLLSIDIPISHKNDEIEILEDLKSALSVYGIHGGFSEHTLASEFYFDDYLIEEWDGENYQKAEKIINPS